MVTIAKSNIIHKGTNTVNNPNQNSKVHNHTTKPLITYNGDNCVCTNKSEIKKWLKCAKEKGSCEGITYRSGKSYLWGLIKTDATYSYKSKRGDTPQKVREMFNLKPGALRKYDNYIFDINEPYKSGQIILFAEKDILP